MQLNFAIPAGFRGTQVTVSTMTALSEQAAGSQSFRAKVIALLNRYNVPGNNPAEIVRLFYRWIKSKIRYVPDPVNLEYVQAPELLLQTRGGDCDDQAALLRAMLKTVGIDCRFVVIGQDAENLEHIYVEALVGSEWMPVDVTGSVPLGQAVRMKYKNTLKGLNAMNKQTGVTVAELYQAVYNRTRQIVTSNMTAGRIVPGDISKYIALIDDGNSPYRGTWVDNAIREALVDYMPLNYDKGAMTRAALSAGLAGFFGSILQGVKGVFAELLGGTKATIDLPDIVVGGSGSGTVSVSPAVASIDFGKYLPYLAIGVVLFLLMGRR